MQKMGGKALADKYQDFHDPNVKVFADGREIAAKEEIYLERAEVVSSVLKEPDMAVLVYRVYQFSRSSAAELERYLAVGQKMEVKAGYGTSVMRIFLGYLHEVQVSGFMQEYVEYTLICLDVKGLMKKNSVFQISGTKKAQQILNDIMGTGCYGGMVETKEVAPLPESLNQDCVIKGETHYDWLCSLAEYLDYEFFCGRGKLVFRTARKKDGEVLELTGEYGLQAVCSIVTMTGQTGNIQVYGYNRKDEKLRGAAGWPGIPGPFGEKLKQTLQNCTLSFWDMGLETGQQASLRAKAVMGNAVGKCTRMEAVHIGIPEFQPGICVKITAENMKSLSGTIYAEEVQHLLDGKGYTTVIRGARV